MHANVTLKPREFVMALSSTAAGGFVGTMVRDLLTSVEHLPSTSLVSVSWTQEIPWVLLAINFAGAFLATRLLRGALRHRDPNDLVRLLVITGFFGGLTSYSGLYVDLAAIWHLCIGGAIAVAVGAVFSGVFAGWLGLMGHRR